MSVYQYRVLSRDPLLWDPRNSAAFGQISEVQSPVTCGRSRVFTTDDEAEILDVCDPLWHLPRYDLDCDILVTEHRTSCEAMDWGWILVLAPV